jgi:hypothetical protein
MAAAEVSGSVKAAVFRKISGLEVTGVVINQGLVVLLRKVIETGRPGLRLGTIGNEDLSPPLISSKILLFLLI